MSQVSQDATILIQQSDDVITPKNISKKQNKVVVENRVSQDQIITTVDMCGFDVTPCCLIFKVVNVSVQ